MTRVLQEAGRTQAAQVSAVQTAVAELEHELRQPLNAAGLYLAAAMQLLTKAGISDGDDAQVAMANAKAELQRISGVLLDTREKCETSASVARGNRRFDLKSLLSEFVHRRTAELVASEITLDLRYTNAGPTLNVVGQPELLCVVLDELMANAEAAMLHATTDTERRIGLSVGPGESGGEVLLEISDTGPGVEHAVRRSPFEAYAHAQPEHLGLGLATCRRLMRRQQGDIRLEPGAGARFVISLQQAAD